ncbi:hypothetical protein K435DRAFT_75769 [Dendrothele bispora CBS 962.96]|uniref:Uncharacterized protein n=1 Tax=Dendrothele bispora (strain CBS 962.96) TaxID=1314807 RepID=A0A4S8MRI7_DENBC|nr:hypothetical protein K435DRAFT_75769 [Dendrothele bispora CBS 962.96]
MNPGESDWLAPESWKSHCTLRKRNRSSTVGSANNESLYTTHSRLGRSTIDLEKDLPEPPASPDKTDSKPVLLTLQPVRPPINTERFPSSPSIHPIRLSPSHSESISYSPKSPFSNHPARRAVSCEQLSKIVGKVCARARKLSNTPIGKGSQLRKWMACNRSNTDPPLFASAEEKRMYEVECSLTATKIDVAISKATKYHLSKEKQDFDPIALYDKEPHLEVKDVNLEKAADISSHDDNEDYSRQSFSDEYEIDSDADSDDSFSTCTSESIPIMLTATKATRSRPLPCAPATLFKQEDRSKLKKMDSVSIQSVSVSSTLSPSTRSSPRSSLQPPSRKSTDTASFSARSSPTPYPHVSERSITPSGLTLAQIQSKFNRDRELPPLPPSSPTRSVSPASSHSMSSTPVRRRGPIPVLFT